MKETSTLVSDSLEEIDKIILFFRDSKHKQHKQTTDLEFLENFESSILSTLYANNKEEYQPTSIFDDTISLPKAKFIGVCLLRLWSADGSIFEFDRNWQRKSIKLFDKLFETNFYKVKELNIKPSDQTFQKVNKLKDFVNVLEEKINSIENYTLDSISSIEGFKKLYLSTIRGTELKNIISQFLPPQVNSTIDNIFNRIKDYICASPDDKIRCYSLLYEDIETLTDSDTSMKTYYNQRIVLDVFQRLWIIVKKDFDASPFSKPAVLSLKGINKKYPFSQTDYEFKLGIVVSNTGAGHAFDVNVLIEEVSGEAEVDPERYVGILKFEDRLLEFRCKMSKPVKDMIIQVRATWTNFDRIQKSVQKEFLLDGQRNDINWENIKYKEFYSTEAVESQDELVGRREILTSLIGGVEGKRVRSAVIYGQRRVGKSSIVKTLKTELEKSAPKENIVFYEETGDYIDPDPSSTINQLALHICKFIRRSHPQLEHIPFPEFRGALSPLTEYLVEVSHILPNCRVLIILDEFDKIPVELYMKGQIGDSFFDTIRAISNKGPYGFLLVGGERMEYIMRDQSQEMNKFKTIRVDYFDKTRHLSDFTDLIVNPIQEFFEITDEAIDYLYNQTAGNPFFTKVICEELISLMINRRDNFITRRDVEEAKSKAVEVSGEQIFAHFWKDGIRDVLVNEEEVTSARRKLLIATTNVYTSNDELTTTKILDRCLTMGLHESISISTLNEFVDRDVLINDGDRIDFKVKFFKDWLLTGGTEKLRTTLVESDRLDHELMTNKLAEIKPSEIVSLVQDWGPYRGNEITTDKVRVWLEQFGDSKNQRIMFKILQNLHFYNDFELKTKLAQLFSQIKRSFIEAGGIRTIKGKEFTRKDLVVSYLEDTPSKSGAEYAKLFADENKIFFKNVMAPDKLERYIDLNRDVHSVIFVDDFIGTGGSAMDNMTRLAEAHPKLFANPELIFHYGVICGFQEGKHKVATRVKRLKINALIHVCDILDDSNKAFEDSSKLFTSPGERYSARAICYHHGSAIEKNAPLGFDNSQALVVFPNTIPNNSLPILWSENKNWKALFPRPM